MGEEAKSKTIHLKHPLKSGDKVIDTITLRRPMAGDLRGVKLIDLVQMDADAVCQLVARISSPLVAPSRFWELDAEDLLSVSMEVVGFFGSGPTPPE